MIGEAFEKQKVTVPKELLTKYQQTIQQLNARKSAKKVHIKELKKEESLQREGATGQIEETKENNFDTAPSRKEKISQSLIRTQHHQSRICLQLKR